MAAKFFGQFLLERGVITREALLDAVQYQKSINLPLCAIAVEKGFLSPDQMADLDREIHESDTEFLSHAWQSRLLTQDQIEELTNTKADRWIFLGESLARKGYVSLQDLKQHFSDFQADQLKKTPVQDIGIPEDDPEKAIVRHLLSATIDLFVHYTQEMVSITSVTELKDEEPADLSCVFAQKIKGEKDFHYTLALPEDFTLLIAGKMMGEELDQVTPMVMDAVSEFVNVVIGNGCVKLNVKDYQVTAEPPQVMTREMIQGLLPSEVVAVQLATDVGEFRVLFFFDKQES